MSASATQGGHKKHSLTHLLCLCGYYTTSLINFLHFLQSTSSSSHICWDGQSFSITSLYN